VGAQLVEQRINHVASTVRVRLGGQRSDGGVTDVSGEHIRLLGRIDEFCWRGQPRPGRLVNLVLESFSQQAFVQSLEHPEPFSSWIRR
jgi:hypothetical protein